MLIINNLDKLIKESAYKTKHIEKELNVNKSTLSSWRNGKTYPGVIQAIQLAKMFNCTVEDIFQIMEE